MKNYHMTEQEFDEFTVRFGAVSSEVEAAYKRLHPRFGLIRRLILAVLL